MLQLPNLVKVQKSNPNLEVLGLGTQVAFVDDYPQKTSELLDRETPEGNKGIPQVGTSAVLAIK